MWWQHGFLWHFLLSYHLGLALQICVFRYFWLKLFVNSPSSPSCYTSNQFYRYWLCHFDNTFRRNNNIKLNSYRRVVWKLITNFSKVRIWYFCVHSKILYALNRDAAYFSGAIYHSTRRHITEDPIFYINSCEITRCHNETACRPNADFLLCRSQIKFCEFLVTPCSALCTVFNTYKSLNLCFMHMLEGGLSVSCCFDKLTDPAALWQQYCIEIRHS